MTTILEKIFGLSKFHGILIYITRSNEAVTLIPTCAISNGPTINTPDFQKTSLIDLIDFSEKFNKVINDSEEAYGKYKSTKDTPQVYEKAFNTKSYKQVTRDNYLLRLFKEYKNNGIYLSPTKSSLNFKGYEGINEKILPRVKIANHIKEVNVGELIKQIEIMLNKIKNLEKNN